MEVVKLKLEDFLTRSNLDGKTLNEAIEIILGNSIEVGPWIAGGAIRRTLDERPLDSDIDVFFKNKEQMDFTITHLKHEGFKESKKTEHHVELVKDKLKIQCINFMYYDKVEDLLDSFDFTICQFATDGKHLYTTPMALWDLARKRLVINKITFGVATLRRLIKYQKQGYYACSGALTQLLEAIADDPRLIQSDVKYVD